MQTVRKTIEGDQPADEVGHIQIASHPVIQLNSCTTGPRAIQGDAGCQSDRIDAAIGNKPPTRNDDYSKNDTKIKRSGWVCGADWHCRAAPIRIESLWIASKRTGKTKT